MRAWHLPPHACAPRHDSGPQRLPPINAGTNASAFSGGLDAQSNPDGQPGINLWIDTGGLPVTAGGVGHALAVLVPVLDVLVALTHHLLHTDHPGHLIGDGGVELPADDVEIRLPAHAEKPTERVQRARGLRCEDARP